MKSPRNERRWQNHPVVRERDVHRARWRWILLAWFVAAAAPMTAYMLEQMAYVRTRYKIEELRVQYDRLNEMEQRLRIKRASLQAPTRVEKIAVRELLLVLPTTREVVVVQPPETRQGDLVAQVPRLP